MLFLDGVYTEGARVKMCFHRVKAPTQVELLSLTHTLSQRVARFLERRGLLERNVENSCLVYEQQEALKADIQPHERPPERAPPVMRLFD